MITPASKTAKETLRRFPHVEIRTLAKYLITNYPELYEGDSEAARRILRYWAGKSGKRDRKKVGDKSLFRGDYVMPVSVHIKRTPHILDPGSWLIMSDVHVPFHSQKAIDICLEYAKMQKVTGILLNGDAQDCNALSTFFVEKRDFIKEVEWMSDFINILKIEFPNIPIIWKPGNHEDRLVQYYAYNAPQLVGLPVSTMDEILGLEKRGILYLVRKQKVMAGKLPILHGHELRGGGANLVSPARWLFLKTKHNAMCSHFHRTSSHRERTIERKSIVTWTTGCLCELDPDYSPEANNWTHGFAIVHFDKSGQFEVSNLEIMDSGKIIES